MCEECNELSRRNFLKGALIGGAALGMGHFRSRITPCTGDEHKIQHMASTYG